MSDERRIGTTLFDLGGTLVKVGEIPVTMKKILDDQGISRSQDEITVAWKEGERELDFRELTTLLDRFWVKWNQRILSKLGLSSNTQQLAEFIATHWWEFSEVSLYPDAEKMLPLLRAKGLKIGVVTNGLQSDVREILPKVNLENFFDAVVVIDTLNKMKPDTEVFHYALKKLNTTTSDAIFVGDEIEADYRGAERSGLSAYLIDRNNMVQDENLNRISSLEDLLELGIIS